MTSTDTDLQLPNWEIPTAVPSTVGEEAYLEWLVQSREQLRADGLLERLRDDPLRRPVDEPFVL